MKVKPVWDRFLSEQGHRMHNNEMLPTVEFRNLDRRQVRSLFQEIDLSSYRGGELPAQVPTEDPITSMRLLELRRQRKLEQAAQMKEIQPRNCHECGDPIPEERLRAVPGTKRCRDCQERKEGSISFDS